MQEECAVPFRSCLDHLEKYVPGRNPEDVQREFDIPFGDILKMASNESAYGACPAALAAIPTAFEKLHLYPWQDFDAIKEAIAEYHGVGFDNIAVGHGSEALISTIPQLFIDAGDEVVVGLTAYTLHEIVSEVQGGLVRRVPLTDYRFDLDAMLAQVNEKTKVVWISNPNNPTGTIVYKDEVARFLDSIPENVVVVLDQAYSEFVSDDQYCEGIDLVRAGRPNVIVLKTFSKAWGLAGLRSGYGIMGGSVADKFDTIKEPFNLGSLCSAASIACLKDGREWLADTVAKIKDGRDYLSHELAELGCDVVPSQANFVLADYHMDARQLAERLVHQGILIRPAAGWGWPTMVRLTVSTPEGNERFIKALKADFAANR
jgi:histidinol-phosphate aminotransferase